MKGTSIVIAAFAAIVFVSCASDGENTLELETVLDLKARREAVLAEAEAEEAEKKEEDRLPAAAEILEASPYKAREIAFFEPPVSFHPIPAGELERLRGEDPATIPPFAESGWRDAGTGVLVLAGAAEMDAAAVSAMTREEFIARLGEVGSVYDEFYGRQFQSQSRLQVHDRGSLIIVDVLSKYVRQDEWQAQKRLFYLFQPGTRLGFVIAGKDGHVMNAVTQLESSFALLEARLLEAYPEGISFQAKE